MPDPRPDAMVAFAARLEQLRTDAGSPSPARLVKLSENSAWPLRRNTTYDKLRCKSVASWEFVTTFVAACATHAESIGRPLPHERTDLHAWSEAHDEMLDLVAAGRAQEALAKAARVERARRMTPAGPARRPPSLGRTAPHTVARPVTAWDPRLLGVGQSISLKHRAGADAMPALVPYVEREHDDELDQLLGEAEQPIMVVLVGGPSTGKSRAAYEALTRNLPDWHLMRPADTADLVNLLTVEASPSRTVLWLDELQRFLDSEGGPAAAGSLHRLLATAGPVVVIGTMWRRYWSAWTTRRTDFDAPVTGPIHRPAEPHPQIRTLLLQARKIDVPETFPEESMAAPTGDPRWQAAVEGARSSCRVIQVLAGGPVLVERYTHPENRIARYSQALVTAAMDARRLGYQSLLPHTLLAETLPAYLDAEERADPPQDWFHLALDYATTHVRGVRALAAHRTQTTMGAPDGYVLDDFLDHHGRETRDGRAVPAALWVSLTACTNNVDDLRRLAHAALDRRLYRIAIGLLRPLAEVATVEMVRDVQLLSDLLKAAGHDEEAQAWDDRAFGLSDWEERPACSGVIDSVSIEIGRALLRMDVSHDPDPDRWHHWVQRGWLGLTAALTLRDFLHDRRSSVREVIRRDGRMWALWRSRAASGDVDSTRVWARMLRLNGDIDGAEDCLRQVAERGGVASGAVMRDLAHLLRATGRPDEAIRWRRDAAAAGDLHATCELSVAAGRGSDAEWSLRHAVEAGDTFACDWLLDRLVGTGRATEAERLERLGIELGGRTASPW